LATEWKTMDLPAEVMAAMEAHRNYAKEIIER